jgi:NTP pyrophosphatase (non-canonical NTP hydrolase)
MTEEKPKLPELNMAALQLLIHSTADEKGWWEDKSPKCIPEKLALIHSEVSEALEEYRRRPLEKITETYYSEGGKPEGLPVELADVIIRILDLAGALGIDMEGAVLEKVGYNLTRSFRHGGKNA